MKVKMTVAQVIELVNLLEDNYQANAYTLYRDYDKERNPIEKWTMESVERTVSKRERIAGLLEAITGEPREEEYADNVEALRIRYAIEQAEDQSVEAAAMVEARYDND